MATTEEIEKYCRNCVSRDFIHGKGLICKLTKEVPTFEGECPNFNKDQELARMAPPKPHDFPVTRPREQLLAEENLRKGVIMATLAGLLGVVAWVVLSIWAGHQVVQMAIVIGVAVGLAMRLGKGVRPVFGIIAAVIAFFSCAVGSFVSIIGYTAEQRDITCIEVLSTVDYGQIFSLMIHNPTMTVLCYGIAVYEAFKFSFRKQNQPKGGQI